MFVSLADTRLGKVSSLGFDDRMRSCRVASVWVCFASTPRRRAGGSRVPEEEGEYRAQSVLGLCSNVEIHVEGSQRIVGVGTYLDSLPLI